jgi:hypothetical protein
MSYPGGVRPGSQRATAVGGRVGVLAASFLLVGCPAEPERAADTGRQSHAVIGGELTRGDPAVVAVINREEDALCSGTLVSPSVVITAAHCSDVAGGAVYFGSDVHDPIERVGVLVELLHPGWDPDAESSEHDIALLLLEAPADPLLPVPLNDSPMDLLKGARLRIAGFGQHDREADGDGKKRQAITVISGAGPGSDVVEYGTTRVSTCFGDSGGPGFVATSAGELLSGVHSFGTGDCVRPNGATRVDRYADDFIRPWIQANDPTCAADGQCAPIGCVGDPDCEPCSRDGLCADGCASPDPDCPTRALGESCLVDAECTSGLCVRWGGSGLYRFCSAPCQPGGQECAAGMSCQETLPFGDVCYFDDEPPAGRPGDRCAEPSDCGSYDCEQGVCAFRCLPGGFCPSGLECSGDSGDGFCVTADEGGCAAGGRAGWIGVVLAMGLFLPRLRRRASKKK